jgi:hypothetical protein
VSVPNGAPQQATENRAEAKRYEFLWRSKDLLDKVEQIIIATDGDGPGASSPPTSPAASAPSGASSSNIPGLDGAEGPERGLLTSTAAASPKSERRQALPGQGALRAADFPEPPPVFDLPVGIDGLDDLFRLTLGTFSVISGWAGHGKTSLLMRMLANLKSAASTSRSGSSRRCRGRSSSGGCGPASTAAESGPIAAELARAGGRADGEAASRHRPHAAGRGTELDLDYDHRTGEGRGASGWRPAARPRSLERDRAQARPGRDRDRIRLPGDPIAEAVRAQLRMRGLAGRSSEEATATATRSRRASTTSPAQRHFANKADYGLIIHRDDLAGNQIEAFAWSRSAWGCRARRFTRSRASSIATGSR